MPTHRLRKRLLERLVKSAGSAAELGLALFMTAGVAHCGGSTQTNTGGGGSNDAAADHGPAGDGSPNPTVEAATFPDAGSDGHISPIIEAPIPVPDAHSPVIEAAAFPDAGADVHISPIIEAPAPSPV
jgi:hypothetical protein